MTRIRPLYIATEDWSGELDEWGEGATPAKALADWARQFASSCAGRKDPVEVRIFRTKKKPPTADVEWYIFCNPEETVTWCELEHHE